MRARVWDFLTGRPQTWRQALVEAVVLGGVFVGVQLLFNVVSTPDNRFLVWWIPLWIVTSMAGYAFWSWLGRRHRPLQESGPPR
jgi:hypothetical protein